MREISKTNCPIYFKVHFSRKSIPFCHPELDWLLFPKSLILWKMSGFPQGLFKQKAVIQRQKITSSFWTRLTAFSKIFDFVKNVWFPTESVKENSLVQLTPFFASKNGWNKTINLSFFTFIFSFCCEAKRKNEPKKKNSLYKRAFKTFFQKFLSTRLSKFSQNVKNL